MAAARKEQEKGAESIIIRVDEVNGMVKWPEVFRE